MKKIVFLSMLFFSMLTVAQENYEVIIMPKKFDFLVEENQYNLNTLCKLFFEKEGFKVYYASDKLPIEIANNRCNALFLDLIEESNMFKTKMMVELKDCQNKVVTNSFQAETREKDLNSAYNEVIRAALVSMKGVSKIKNSHVNLILNEKNNQNKVISNENVVTVNSIEALQSVISSKGYNLIDQNKNLKFELSKTTNPTIFIAKKGSIQGIFTLNGKNSKFESYQNDVLVVEEVEVKF